MALYYPYYPYLGCFALNVDKWLSNVRLINEGIYRIILWERGAYMVKYTNILLLRDYVDNAIREDERKDKEAARKIKAAEYAKEYVKKCGSMKEEKFCGDCGDSIASNRRFCDVCIKIRGRKKAKDYQAKVRLGNPALWLLKRMRRRADHKKMEFSLTVEDCTDLGDCYYCGVTSDGFDRINSKIGYTKDNVVPACTVCNSMKWTLEQDTFIEHCKWIASRF